MQHPYQYYACLVGNKLSKTLDEIGDMDAEEFHQWIAFFNLEDKDYRDRVQDLLDQETMDPTDYILKHYYKSTNGKSNK